MTDPVGVSDQQLTEWQRRSDEATPGPWDAADEHGDMLNASPAWCVSRMDGEKWLYDIAYVESGRHGDKAEPDAVFMAAARTAVPVLLAEVSRLQAEVELHSRYSDADTATAVAMSQRALAAEARLAAVESRVKAALEVIGEDGCNCEPSEDASCTNHRIEAALSATPAEDGKR